MPDMTRTQRCLHLFLKILEKGRLSTREAMNAVGVENRRLIQKDLKEIATIAPIKRISEGRDTRWIIRPGFEILRPGLMHAIALELGRELTQFMSGSGLSAGLESIAPTTFDTFGSKWRRNIDRKFYLQHEPHRNYEGHNDIVLNILDGLLRERSLRIVYERPDGSQRIHESLWPLTLVVYRRALYLIVTREDNRIFDLSIDRISSAKVGSPFTYPVTWKPDTHLSKRFGMVAAGEPERITLRFAAHMRPWVEERIWHPTQQVLLLDDGRLELSMDVSGRELKRMVLEWGEHCEVIEPRWLRDEVAQTAQRILAQYSPVSQPKP